MAGWAALLCVAGGGAVAAPGSVDEAAPDRIQVGTVRDLNYGDGLFYFFQGESLESLTRFEAYSRWQQMPNHQAEADLLLGGLYLELGLHNEAGARFEQLLGPQVPVGVRNRAWFYLARVWYARGYDERAEQALRRLQGVLDADLESQRMHLLANVAGAGHVGRLRTLQPRRCPDPRQPARRRRALPRRRRRPRHDRAGACGAARPSEPRARFRVAAVR
jgi:tetratricopeptide (TPR) repeat protein